MRLWSAAGIGHCEISSLTTRMDFESFADYWDPLLGGQGPVGGYVAGLDGEMRAEICSRVNLAFIAGRPD